MKILHLASWYPSKNNEFEGIFVKKHIEAISEYVQNYVIYLKYDSQLNKLYKIEIDENKNCVVFYVYLKNLNIELKGFNTLLKIVHYYYVLFLAIFSCIKKYGLPKKTIIHVASKIGIPALLLKIFLNIPYYIIEHSTLYCAEISSEEYYKNITRIEHKINEILYKNSNGIIAVSNYLINRLKEHFRINTKSFYVIPNVISIKKVESHHNENYCLSISSLKKVHKRIEELIIGFSKSLFKENNFKLVIVGDGPDKDELINLTKGLGLLNTYIIFKGYIANKDLWPLYSHSSFLIINSLYETFSIVAAESLGYGKPVLTTPCGGPQEFINENNGIVLKDFTEECLIEGLNKMYLDYHKFNSKELIENAIKKFSSNSIQDLLLTIVNNS